MHEVLLVSGALLSLLRFCNFYCYSNYNLLFILYSQLTGKHYLLQYARINMAATVITWYASWTFDAVPTKMIEKFNLVPAHFYIGDVVMHVLPALYMARRRDIIQTDPYAGLYTLLIHLMWALGLQDPFDISSSYIEMQFVHKKILWLITTSVHLSALLLA